MGTTMGTGIGTGAGAGIGTGLGGTRAPADPTLAPLTHGKTTY